MSRLKVHLKIIEVLIDDLWNIYKDTITQIDCGSLFDPYVGRKTRTYHKNLEVK